MTNKGLDGRNKSSHNFSEKIRKKVKRKDVTLKTKVLILCEDSGSFLTYFCQLGWEARAKFDVKAESYKGYNLIHGSNTLLELLENNKKLDLLSKYDKVFLVYDLDRVFKYLKEAVTFRKNMAFIKKEHGKIEGGTKEENEKRYEIEEVRSNPFSEIWIVQHFTASNLGKCNSLEKICEKLNTLQQAKHFGIEGGVKKFDEQNIKREKTQIYNTETRKKLPYAVKNAENRDVENDCGSEIYKIIKYFGIV